MVQSHHGNFADYRDFCRSHTEDLANATTSKRYSSTQPLYLVCFLTRIPCQVTIRDRGRDR